MAISEEFLKLFGGFVTNYKCNGAPSIYSWTKEKNHEFISSRLDELLAIISANKETIHDASIIDNLNTTVLLSAKSNPYLLTCWIDFINEYNTTTKMYTPLGTLEMTIGPTGVPSERMIGDLKKALISQHTILESTQKVHQAEIEQFKKQISDLQLTTGKLRIQNDQLKALISDRSTLEAMHPEIRSTQEHLRSFSKLLGTLLDVTKPKPTAEVLLPPTALPPVSEESKDKELSGTPNIVLVDESPDPSPSFVPPPPQSPITTSTHTSERIPQGPKTASTKPFFFASSKDLLLLHGIQDALAKMKQKKQERASDASVDDEKKKLSHPL